jgi:peptide deformylase
MTAASPAGPAFDLEAWVSASPDVAALVQAGAAVLRRPSFEVPRELLSSRALARLVDIMVATMRAAPGVGLAAPQIGVPLRLFVAEDDEERMARLSPESRTARRRTVLPLVVIANPKLTPTSTETMTFFEGCLSVRGYGALVARAAGVRLSGLDMRGEPVAMELEGWPARILQHEVDHLDGVLYVDRMLTRSFACDAELPRLSGMAPAEVLAEIGEGGA